MWMCVWVCVYMCLIVSHVRTLHLLTTEALPLFVRCAYIAIDQCVCLFRFLRFYAIKRPFKATDMRLCGFPRKLNNVKLVLLRGRECNEPQIFLKISFYLQITSLPIFIVIVICSLRSKINVSQHLIFIYFNFSFLKEAF